MSEADKEALIISLCFLSGKDEWWYANKSKNNMDGNN